MRISDWSSDVCSSDLLDLLVVEFALAQAGTEFLPRVRAGGGADQGVEHALFGVQLGLRLHLLAQARAGHQAGDFRQVTDGLLDRKRVAEGKRVSVRVTLGGRRTIKKKNKRTYMQM